MWTLGDDSLSPGGEQPIRFRESLPPMTPSAVDPAVDIRDARALDSPLQGASRQKSASRRPERRYTRHDAQR